jgi:cysteinyl-tRNA synthetase
MSDETQNEPVQAGSGDATNDQKLRGLIEQVDKDHGDEGAAAMADHLRDRLDETGIEAEDGGDSQN